MNRISYPVIVAEGLRVGLPAEALPQRCTEQEAVRGALEWARPGDVLLLPVHGLAAREVVLAMLGRSAARPSRQEES